MLNLGHFGEVGFCVGKALILGSRLELLLQVNTPRQLLRLGHLPLSKNSGVKALRRLPFLLDYRFGERCPPRQKPRVERLKAEVEPVST